MEKLKINKLTTYELGTSTSHLWQALMNLKSLIRYYYS
jgi:hypothetical protein